MKGRAGFGKVGCVCARCLAEKREYPVADRGYGGSVRNTDPGVFRKEKGAIGCFHDRTVGATSDRGIYGSVSPACRIGQHIGFVGLEYQQVRAHFSKPRNYLPVNGVHIIYVVGIEQAGVGVASGEAGRPDAPGVGGMPGKPELVKVVQDHGAGVRNRYRTGRSPCPD